MNQGMKHLFLRTHLVSLHVELNPQRVNEIFLGLNLTLIFGFELNNLLVGLIFIGLFFGNSLLLEIFKLFFEVGSLKLVLHDFLFLLLLDQGGLEFILTCDFGGLLLDQGDLFLFFLGLFTLFSLELLRLLEILHISFELLVLFLDELQSDKLELFFV